MDNEEELDPRMKALRRMTDEYSGMGAESPADPTITGDMGDVTENYRISDPDFDMQVGEPRFNKVVTEDGSTIESFTPEEIAAKDAATPVSMTIGTPVINARIPMQIPQVVGAEPDEDDAQFAELLGIQ